MEGSGMNEQQLSSLIQSLHEQVGMLDEHFDNVKGLQNEENPNFVWQVITTFCSDAENTIGEITILLLQPVVNFVRVTGHAYLLKGSSSCLGCCRVALACRELQEAADSRNIDKCLAAFDKIRKEFYIIRENLNRICQMEKANRGVRVSRGQKK